MDQVDVDLDKAYMILQERIGIADRALAAPAGETMSMTIPSESLRGGKLLGFDPVTKQPIATDPSGSVVPVGTMTDSFVDIPSTHAVQLGLAAEAAARDAAIALDSPNWELIIDSNAKLDQWINHIGGALKRVLIKEGSWTASSLGPTAGVLINLDSTGTVFVRGEIGSSINYSGPYASVMYGFYHSSKPSIGSESFYDVKVNINNTTGNTSHAFYECSNLINCIGNATTNLLDAFGFNSCDNLTNCVGYGTSSGREGYGFHSCNKLINCIGTGLTSTNYSGMGFRFCCDLTNCTGNGTSGSAVGHGFYGCGNLNNCGGTGTGAGASGGGTGFSACSNVSNSIGFGTAPGSGAGAGFSSCAGVVNCTGTGNSISGIGYGFVNGRKLLMNKTGICTGSTNAKYNTSSVLAAGTTYIAAAGDDSATGGWNT
jgi:hypothetical protein